MGAAASQGPAGRRRTLTFGALCAGLGAVVGYAVSRGAVGEGWAGLTYYAAAAAGLTSMPLWWLGVERRQAFRTGRGALLGAIGGLLAHYPCWYLAILGHNVSYWLLGHGGSSAGEAPVDPLRGLSGALVLSFWSWLLFGWLTAAVGAVAAGCYASIVRRRIET